MNPVRGDKWFDGESGGSPTPAARSVKTAIEGEITADRITNGCALAFGIVTDCEDSTKSGRIKVKSQLFGPKSTPCDYVSPIGGAGYGLMAVPGIGATVLVGNSPFSDPPCSAFWMGVLYAPGQEDNPDIRSQPYKDEITARVEIKDDGTIPEVMVSHGIPNMDEVYQDNNLPDSFVLKHPTGHAISLTHKVTDERNINEIKLKTAENKRIIMSDAPPSAGGEAITLVDENDNLIRITSMSDDNPDSIVTEAGKNIQVLSKAGEIDHTIGPDSDQDYSITNVGTGDIAISANEGNITIEAAQSITLKCGNSEIKMTPTSIEVKANLVDVVGSSGNVSIMGTTLLTHTHGDPDIFGGVTTPGVG